MVWGGWLDCVVVWFCWFLFWVSLGGFGLGGLLWWVLGCWWEFDFVMVDFWVGFGVCFCWFVVCLVFDLGFWLLSWFCGVGWYNIVIGLFGVGFLVGWFWICWWVGVFWV